MKQTLNLNGVEYLVAVPLVSGCCKGCSLDIETGSACSARDEVGCYEELWDGDTRTPVIVRDFILVENNPWSVAAYVSAKLGEPDENQD